MLVLALALLGALAIPSLTAALLALTIGRFAGLFARMALMRRLPQSPVEHLPRVVHAQLPFALATVAFVIQGQADILAVGFLSSLALAAVYAPLLRTAYSTLLSAEALSWALFGGAHPDEHEAPGRLARHWRPVTLALGVGVAIVFVLLAEPFLRLLLDRHLPDLEPAILLFGLVIVTRFGALTAHVDILRAGRQRDEVAVLFVSAALLAVFGSIAASNDSLTGLAAARLVSEVVIAAGFLLVRRRGPAAAPPEARPVEPAPRKPVRVLMLAPFPPSLQAAHGGARVLAQRIVRLAEHADIAVLCLRAPWETPPDQGVLDAVELLEEVPRPEVTSPAARALRFVRWRAALVGGRPFWASDVRHPAYRRRLEELVARFEPDVVQFEFAPMAQYLPALGGGTARCVLVEHDPEAGTARGGRTLTGRLDTWAARRLRRRALRDVDAAVVFTERDRAALAPLAGSTPIERIPFGVDLDSPVLDPGESDGSVLFFGNFVHLPNVDAARRLVGSIFPRVRASHPDCTLQVVGDRPPPDLASESSPGVVVTGWVPDLEPYLRRAAVVVAPLRRGGGMRVKVAEALAAGAAVVASPLATEGLDVADGEQLRLASSDAEFAERIAALLADPAARRALGGRARSCSEAHLSWDASIAAYEELYARLLDGSQPLQELHVGPSPGVRSHTRTIHSP